jgi:DNA-binding CsgD family transcriptional regulator/N-acetylneuraminic acid mutarotase
VEDSSPNIQLSKREQEVLELVVTGASNKEIAQSLVISVNTVKVHVRNIFEKLNVQSRTEATLVALQEQLVGATDDEGETAAQSDQESITRTFLSDSTVAQPLVAWQQYYLLASLLLSLLVVTVPLIPRNTPRTVPNLPVIYAQPVTPTPLPPPDNTRSTRWRPHSAMPTNRAGLAVVAVEQEIFAMGGVRDNNKATRTVEIYDTIANSWSEGATKPTAATNIAGVTIGEQIYVPGGCTNDGQAEDVFEIYNPTTDSWESGTPLPEPRCGYGLAVVSDTLYLFGGWNGKSFEDTILSYQPQSERWEKLDTRLANSTGFMGTGVIDGIIYLVGGYDGDQEFNTTYAFDPQTNQLTQKSSMQEQRGGLAVVTGGKDLYAIGGGWNHSSTSSEKYNPATDTWTSLETPFSGQWRNLGLATVGTSIYAIGGWNGDEETFMDSVVSYQFIYQLFIPISSQAGD